MDTLFRGHGRFSADGAAVLMPRVHAKRPSADTVEVTLVELKNRADHRPSCVRVTGSLAPVNIRKCTLDGGVEKLTELLWLQPRHRLKPP